MTIASMMTALLLASPLPSGLSDSDAVELEDGVRFFGLEAPASIAVGVDVPLRFYFGVDGELPPNVTTFVHLESTTSRCRAVRDAKPPAASNGVVAHEMTLTVFDHKACDPQRLEVYVGLYHRKTGKRVKLISPKASDNRIHAGFLALDRSGSHGSVAVFTPSAMAGERFNAFIQPWHGWLLALAIGFALMWLLRWLVFKRTGGLQPLQLDPPSTRARRLAFLGVVGVLIASIVVAVDFVKDDAYISFRYAQNVVNGNGLVFNNGEYLEGITNFFWTILMVPFEALGLDLFQVCEVLGTLLCIGMLLALSRTAVLMHGMTRYRADLWAALWIATASNVALWSTSGMEQPLAMFAPIMSAYLLWSSWRSQAASGDEAGAVPPVGTKTERNADGPDRRPLYSGLLMGVACLTRPEIHLIGILVGLPLLWRVVRHRRLDRVTLMWGVGLLAVTVPLHLFRLLYYGSLLPNTFFVKTGDSTLALVAGAGKLREMFDFNNLGVLVALTPFAFLDRRRVIEKLVMVGIVVGFMGFVVKVGVDEMRWHRLYLPALPFLALLAALGLENIVRAFVKLVSGVWPRRVIWLMAWAGVIVASALSFTFTYNSMGGFNGRGDLSGNYHPDMGKFITRHAAPGALAAFQDMGSTPYHAPDIAFFDFIGLVEGTVARARYDYGLHAFMATESRHNQRDFNRDMREYFYERNPEWVILTSYVRGQSMDRVAEKFAKEPTPASIGGAIGSNSFQFGIYNRKFQQNYVHVRTWPRSRSYYLSLFERRDLWEQTPGEVVLDAVPEGLTGPKATLTNGLKLLGSDVQSEATQRHEFFATTWWELPGPLADDVFFFIHAETEGRRIPYDHIPGDWMYPAPRWQAGQILENRVLVQLPPGLPTGEYKVYMGVYHRKTGQRFVVEEGQHDGQNRVLIGTVNIDSLTPPFDQLIKPTRLDEQRVHPERIVKHGRQPGQ